MRLSLTICIVYSNVRTECTAFNVTFPLSKMSFTCHIKHIGYKQFHANVMTTPLVLYHWHTYQLESSAISVLIFLRFSLDRYFTFFSVSSAKFNSFVIKAGLEQRILNEAAIFLSSLGLFPIFFEPIYEPVLVRQHSTNEGFFCMRNLEQNAVNNSPQPKLVGGRLSLVKHTPLSLV